MSVTLVDSNVILDIVTEDPTWLSWSTEALSNASEQGDLAINPIIYAEISVAFERIEGLDDAVPSTVFHRLPLPWSAGFLVGKVFLKYRQQKGSRPSALPDFYIGAHAAAEGLTLLTRDSARYRTYFPRLKIISPIK